ncbi:MAG: hypothetical protein ACRCX8_19980 [Sarcina sp.]
METKSEIEQILGYEIIQKEVKKYIINNPKVRGEVEEWLTESMGKGHLKSIRRCNLHVIDEDIDESELDEHELLKYRSKIKHNHKTCPGHQTCPIFLSGSTSPDERCVLELVETQFLINGLIKELNVDPEDFNDQIVIGQLVTMNILYNRAMEGLASTTLIEEIKTYQKGTTKIESKVSEYFTIAERCLHQMDKLRKSLVLNRDDKLKVKMVKKANSEAIAKKKVDEKIKAIESGTTVNADIIAAVIGEAANSDTNNKIEVTTSIADSEIIDI